MTMDHVEFAEPVRKSVGIALAQQGRFALPLQGNFGIDAGMDVDALLVDIDQPQPVEPGDMSLRHVGWVATVGSQGSVTALLDPGTHFRSSGLLHCRTVRGLAQPDPAIIPCAEARS